MALATKYSKIERTSGLFENGTYTSHNTVLVECPGSLLCGGHLSFDQTHLS